MSEHFELVKTLRNNYDKVKAGWGAAGMYLDCNSAANAIEQLTADNARLRAKLEKAEAWIDKCALKMEELAVGELSSNVFTISSLHRAAKELRKFAMLKEGKHE